MAISKATAINGVSGNFWVTSNVYISPDYSHARLTMALYASQAAYVSGADAVYQNDYLLNPGPYNKVNLSAIGEAALISGNSQFSGGSQVSGF